MAKKITTPEFRVSFANVFKPRAFEGQEPKYSLCMLFDKKTDLSALQKLAADAVAEKWPNPSDRPKGLRNPFRDGDKEKADVEGYEGKIFINASTKMKPGIVDQDVQPIISEEDFYSGCYARATLTAYAYDTAGNRGVAFGLQNLQKLRDGEAFSGRAKAEDEFSPVDSAAGPSGSTESVEEMWS